MHMNTITMKLFLKKKTIMEVLGNQVESLNTNETRMEKKDHLT